MASKLTSQASCIQKSTGSYFEGEGIGGKGGHDKVQWDSWTLGETWLDATFLDESLFGTKCSSGRMGSKGSQNLWKTDLSELEWLSKDMAMQEFVSTDRSTSWFDLDSRNREIYREENEADIMSTFTAIASVFRDWCLLEKDITKSEKNSKVYCGCEKYGDSLEYKLNSGKQTGFLTSLLAHSDYFRGGPLDLPMEKVWAEDYRNQLGQSYLSLREDICHLAHSIYMSACQEEKCVRVNNDLGYYLRSRSDSKARMYENCQGVNSKFPEDEDYFVQATIMKESIMAADDSLKDCNDMELCSIFGKQIFAASRFSFGQDGNEVLIANADVSEKFEDNKGISGFVQSNDLMAAELMSYHHHKEVGHKKNESMAQDYISEYCCKHMEPSNMQADDLVPEGLLYALSYMDLHDLLKMERVCGYLRNRIKSDVLLWQQLHVELPMSNNLTDEVLLELAARSRGQLQILSLVDCARVTEAALEKIVSTNPRLVKLALPGCSRISADAVVRMVEGHMNRKPARVATLMQLRVRNMDGFTKEHLDKLQKMVGVKTQEQSSTRKPQYYHLKHQIFFQDDDRGIDVEVCPKCTNVRLVYDCTRERCQQKKVFSECRACILCIVRCEACGRCITDNNYEETFALDVLCSCCWLGSPKCADCNRPDICNPANCAIRAPETRIICCENFPDIQG